MGGTAFLFAGQGAQYTGMGRYLYDEYAIARETFEEAERAADLPIREICFEYPHDELRRTELAQPAILTVAVATWRVLQAAGVEADAALGLSLGEYGALVAAGCLDWRDALPLVRLRGRLMQEAVPEGTGGMIAVLGLDDDVVEDLCRAAEGTCEPANYNAPGQVVVAGDNHGLESFTALAHGHAAKLVRLSVSAPFHSTLLREAGVRLRPALAAVNFQQPRIPVIANLTARPVTGVDVAETLERQIYQPVRFSESLRYLLEAGYTRFIEVGPGRAQVGFLKRIRRDVEMLTTDHSQDLAQTLECAKEVC